MFDRGSGGDPGPPLFGIVRFEPGGDRRVRDTVITFPGATAADLFAIEQGWHDYQVTSLRFFVHDVRPAAVDWTRYRSDDLAARFADRRRWP
ncbi:hypothetical protein ThrDRAFT_02310 [Frankia casuarinae]|jgi:hypothetical protein|uniref:Uncharacterized protein n=1 Tax=Frankia casuarinae (strain DSM 45818 / CECT 9043 / HFP020203 / CcI3) TaxID=106370 RepID=Q2JDX6_FRACC|nr:hypothetical protein [Frankia casuarinae]ABD10516.1 hypothetical protein Francci3_1137 [Frankia casuarinae]EYT92065.1 hypothetical protein ThrDRAFT_02310 [Frankia casuarinae]